MSLNALDKKVITINLIDQLSIKKNFESNLVILTGSLDYFRQ